MILRAVPPSIPFARLFINFLLLFSPKYGGADGSARGSGRADYQRVVRPASLLPVRASA